MTLNTSRTNKTLSQILNISTPDLPGRIHYPDLPVSARRDDILAALKKNRVVILCGETGSGKTTQIPKMCLELGVKPGKLIGCTQPRRIAARSVATRIAHELGGGVGRPGRLQGALHRQGASRHRDQDHDRRHPAGRKPGRSAAFALRHDHHRRGARAQPQHRFPARLSANPGAEAQRPAGGDHLRHHRCRTFFQALQQRAGDRGVGADLSGGNPLAADRA